MESLRNYAFVISFVRATRVHALFYLAGQLIDVVTMQFLGSEKVLVKRHPLFSYQCPKSVFGKVVKIASEFRFAILTLTCETAQVIRYYSLFHSLLSPFLFLFFITGKYFLFSFSMFHFIFLFSSSFYSLAYREYLSACNANYYQLTPQRTIACINR